MVWESVHVAAMHTALPPFESCLMSRLALLLCSVGCTTAGAAGTVASRFAVYSNSTFSFDCSAFAVPKREALLMDPQQRILLEETLSALCDAGHAINALQHSSTGTDASNLSVPLGSVSFL